MFVPNLKIIGTVVPEKSLTKKKFTHTHTRKKQKIKQKVSKAHIPPAVAITGHTTLNGEKEKWTNQGTDKQYVAEFFKHSSTCHS